MGKKSKDTSFEPKIMAFVCKWCTYSGADLAGTSRMDYSPNVRMVRVQHPTIAFYAQNRK